jgi:hypothetical protein
VPRLAALAELWLAELDVLERAAGIRLRPQPRPPRAEQPCAKVA